MSQASKKAAKEWKAKAKADQQQTPAVNKAEQEQEQEQEPDQQQGPELKQKPQLIQARPKVCPQQYNLPGHWADSEDEAMPAINLRMPSRQHEPFSPNLEEPTVGFFDGWNSKGKVEQAMLIHGLLRRSRELRAWARWINIELNTGINTATKLELMALKAIEERNEARQGWFQAAETLRQWDEALGEPSASDRVQSYKDSKQSAEASSKAAEVLIAQATEPIKKVKAGANLAEDEVKPVVDGIVELQEAYLENQRAGKLRERDDRIARFELEMLDLEQALDEAERSMRAKEQELMQRVAREAALEAGHQAYHLAMIATATSGNEHAYDTVSGPVGFEEADGTTSANLNHPYWRGRQLVAYLYASGKLRGNDWYGADDLTRPPREHRLSLQHPYGKTQSWGYFTGIQHALRDRKEPDLSGIPLPKAGESQ